MKKKQNLFNLYSFSLLMAIALFNVNRLNSQSYLNVGLRVNKSDVNNNLYNIYLYSGLNALSNFSIQSNVSSELSYMKYFSNKKNNKVFFSVNLQNDRLDFVRYFKKAGHVNLQKLALGLGYEFQLLKKNSNSLKLEASCIANKRISKRERLTFLGEDSWKTEYVNNDTSSSFEEHILLNFKTKDLFLTPKVALNYYIKTFNNTMRLSVFYQWDLNKFNHFKYDYSYTDHLARSTYQFNYETDKFRSKIIGISIGYMLKKSKKKGGV